MHRTRPHKSCGVRYCAGELYLFLFVAFAIATVICICLRRGEVACFVVLIATSFDVNSYPAICEMDDFVLIFCLFILSCFN